MTRFSYLRVSTYLGAALMVAAVSCRDQSEPASDSPLADLEEQAFNLDEEQTGALVLAPLVVDFKQGANNDTTGGGLCTPVPGCIHWISSIVQSSNSIYFEGMSNPQRVVFTNIPSGTSHTMTFSHQWTKGGIHAYDFLTGYDDAMTVAPSPPFPAPGIVLNECGQDIGPPGSLQGTCCDLHDYASCPGGGAPGGGAHFMDFSIPDDGTPAVVDPVDGALAPRIAAYEAMFGNRTIRIYADQPVTGATMTYALVGSPAGDSDLNYTLTWTTGSASTQAIIEMAGHLAVSGDPAMNALTWGPDQGSSNISGGPYHFNLFTLNGASLGSQDNQIKGADIMVPATGACCVPCPNAPELVFDCVDDVTEPECDALDPLSIFHLGEACADAPCGDPCPPDQCVAECPPDVAIECDESLDPAVNPSLGMVTCSDTCTGDCVPAFTDVSDGMTCPETITRTWMCTCTSSGAVSECVQTITVDDTTPPEITCPAGFSVQCAEDVPACDRTDASATDNCDTNVEITCQQGPLVGGACGGTVTNTYTATDDCGNTDVCTQTITVNDTTPPEIACPAGFSVQCADDVPACDPLDASATDNCDLDVEIACVQGPLVGGACGGTVTNTYTATDDCGNTDTCTQTITVDDTIPPMITCPAGFSVQCADDVPACDPADASATDNCDDKVEITCQQGPLVGGACGGTVTRTYTATDDCGNTDSCTQVITVDDTTPPEITCPKGFSVQCEDDVPACDPADASATDNCDDNVMITCQQGPLVGGACGGTLTITYTATDDCGNTDTCTQTITVDDTIPPEITCPAGFSVQCEEDVPPCDPADASATDNCDLDVEITCLQGPLVGGACGGTVTNTYTATDDCGNTDTCTQIITVDDTTPPVLGPCPANIEECEGVPIGPLTCPSATDNCDPAPVVTCTRSDGAPGLNDPFPLGTTTITVVATDACGNESSCSFTVTVVMCGEGCTPGFWKNHTNLWNDGCGDPSPGDDVTLTIKTCDLFNATFGVPMNLSKVEDDVTLLEAMSLDDGAVDGCNPSALARHAAAALANADSGIDYPFTLQEVIDLYRDAVGADAGPETICTAKTKLEMANMLGCPCNDSGCP